MCSNTKRHRETTGGNTINNQGMDYKNMDTWNSTMRSLKCMMWSGGMFKYQGDGGGAGSGVAVSASAYLVQNLGDGWLVDRCCP